MSEFSRETLLNIIETDHVQCGEASALARMALAAMDSEPVILYRERNPYNGLTTGWQVLTENEFSFLKENAGENAEFLTLYRHAQPAPVIPDFKKLARELVVNLVDCGGLDEGVKEKYLEWVEKTCRAAMLAAAPHDTPALNSVQSVVTGSDTWIQVSERMPEKGQAVLVYRPKAHEGGDSDVRVAVYGRHNFEHGFGCYWEPSHWMPLPAAPQEVGDA
ncbi:TPA: DUF551 domain-containing protein [Klebsiella pneumoniae]|nr:DUF551 domain-containing protein [Klebsiella pneumoniae]